MAVTEIRIENLSRSPYCFPITGRVGTDNHLVQTDQVLIGGADDKRVEGERDEAHRPDPVVTIPLEKLKKLHPRCIETLLELEQRKDLECRPPLAEIKKLLA